LDFPFYDFFCDLLCFFKDLVKIKNKRKGEKPLSRHPQTAQGGYMNSFVSLRRLDPQFCDSRRKKQIRPKVEEGKKKLFPKENRGKASRNGAGDTRPSLAFQR